MTRAAQTKSSRRKAQRKTLEANQPRYFSGPAASAAQKKKKLAHGLANSQSSISLSQALPA